MMFGRELRLPDTPRYNHSPDKDVFTQEYVIGIEQRMKQAHQMLQDQQAHMNGEEDDKPLSFSEGDMVLLEKRKKKSDSSKLQPPFCEPYKILKAFPNHT